MVPDKNKLVGRKRKSISKNLVLTGIVAAIAIVALAFWIKNMSNSGQEISDAALVQELGPKSLAVLPFTNMSSGEENQYFCDGMHDDLLTHLSQRASMKVISRTSVLRYRDTELPIPEIAGALGVSHILEGSFRRVDNQIRINVQLIDAVTDSHVWSEIYLSLIHI